MFHNVNAGDSNTYNTTTDVKIYKKFDYTKLIKDASNSVKKEVDQYYNKLDEAYVNLSDGAKKEISKIANYKRSFFSKRKYNAKKDTNS